MLWFCRSTLSAEDEVEVLKGLPEREIEERVHARKARLSACIALGSSWTCPWIEILKYTRDYRHSVFLSTYISFVEVVYTLSSLEFFACFTSPLTALS
jgi:hypothetical protein